jgi:hypothetical protein
MKIIIAHETYEELLLNLMYTYQNTIELRKGNAAINTINIIYEFLVSSSLIDEKVRAVLQSHLNGNYDKSYDLLMYQCDYSNNFYDILADCLIELEYYEFYLRLAYINGIKSFNVDKSSAHTNANTKLQKYRNMFIIKNNKLLKFFNIDSGKIINRVENTDYVDPAFEISNEKCKIFNRIIDSLLVMIVINV